MGGSSSSTTTQSQNSTTAPWAPAQPFLNSILDQLNGAANSARPTSAETGALNTLTANAANASQYAPQMSSLVSNLFGGGGATAQAGNIQSNLNAYRNVLAPYANGTMVGNNPALKAHLDTIASDVGNAVNAQFAGAGRDLSGLNQQALARGIAQGEAPVLANQYNQDVQTQLGAANALYGAGNTTSGLLGGLNQQALANQQAGASLAPSALDAQNASANATLQAEAQRRGVPLQALQLLAQIGIPIAGLGSQTSGSGTSRTDNEMSGAQQFNMIASGLGSLWPKFGK
jgi:hypothetical protein